MVLLELELALLQQVLEQELELVVEMLALLPEQELQYHLALLQ
jgi:hypothetical protein